MHLVAPYPKDHHVTSAVIFPVWMPSASAHSVGFEWMAQPETPQVMTIEEALNVFEGVYTTYLHCINTLIQLLK